MKYNMWNKWDKLKVCMIGNSFAPEFFDGLKNDKVATPLKRICEETLEDLEKYRETLQQFGVEVIQPEIDSNERFNDNPDKLPRPPIHPRDSQLIIGNNAYTTQGHDPAISKCLQDYDNNSGSYVDFTSIETSVPHITEKYYDEVKGDDYPAYDVYLQNLNNPSFFPKHVVEELVQRFVPTFSHCSADTFMIGKDVYLNMHDPDWDQEKHTEKNMNRVKEVFKDFRQNHVYAEGHADGNFHVIKPGAILTLHEVQTYAKTFPGWDVCYFEEQGMSEVLKDKHKLDRLRAKNRGKWWLANEEDNDEFTDFVETFLQPWVGYCEESVFDVNVLVLDEHHVAVSQTHNEVANNFFKKHNMEPVYIPYRHRYFWDGGLHCQSLDIYREGTQTDYFPDRTGAIVDDQFGENNE